MIMDAARRTSQSPRGRMVFQAGAWTTSGYIATQLLRTITTLVLARNFLGPEAFGTVGLVGVFISGLAMFSELGITANVVQHARGEEPSFLNTAFSIQAARGLAIWSIAAACAYPMAAFYHQPELLPLLVVCGISELVRGLTSTAAWTLTRRVELRSITLLTIASEVVGTVVGIAWAAASPTAWALIARTIACAVIYAAGSHLIAKPAVKFAWDRSAAKAILHFGGWISISTATYFLSGQGERLILGKVVTAAELGCFSVAVMITSMPAGGINQLVSQIFLPLLSKSVRTSAADSVKDFEQARRAFFWVGLVAALGFLACGKIFVSLLLPAKYAMAGWMVQMLGVKVALDVFAAPASTLILAHGEARYSAMASTVRLVFMICGLYIAFLYFGTFVAVLSLLLAQAISYIPVIQGVAKVMPTATKREIAWYCAFVCVLVLLGLVRWPG
jgi:O-antigen/teichoic acid export membrane protein